MEGDKELEQGHTSSNMFKRDSEFILHANRIWDIFKDIALSLFCFL